MGVFVFNDTATTEIYTLSLHDALPISIKYQNARHLSGWLFAATPSFLIAPCGLRSGPAPARCRGQTRQPDLDRKSTRLNSSHANISYAVFCLKKKNQ